MSNLLSSTYNPDVLSCLANLSNDEVFTPPQVANQMLDMLPDEIWHDTEATFLDPACKSGVFLREIAKRLIRAQLPNYEQIAMEINDRERRGETLTSHDLIFRDRLQEVCDHIFKKQLFGMAITELTSLLSRRSVYCSKYPECDYSVVRFDNPEGNIDYKRLDHKWTNDVNEKRCQYCGASYKEYNREKGREQYAYEFIHLDNPAKVFDMKFDVIIGNPPYQMGDGGNKNSARPIYQYFVEKAKKLNPRYLVMITPSRWLSGGKGLDQFRTEMLNDPRIRKMVDYINAKDCFPQNSISGGVNYFLWDRDHPGDCEITTVFSGTEDTRTRSLNEFDSFVRFNTAVDIIRKIKNHQTASIANMVSSRNPFGFPTSSRGRQQKEEGDFTLISSKGKGYVSLDEVLTGQLNARKYNILLSRIVYEHAGEPDKEGKLRVLSKIDILKPKEVCTDSYLSIGPFDTEEEASHMAQYLRTKFARFLIAQTLSSINLSKDKFEFVPLIPLDQPIDDQVLYETFELSQEERDFIENTMHSMDNGD